MVKNHLYWYIIQLICLEGFRTSPALKDLSLKGKHAAMNSEAYLPCHFKELRKCNSFYVVVKYLLQMEFDCACSIQVVACY